MGHLGPEQVVLRVLILYFTEQTQLRLPEGDLRARTRGVPLPQHAATRPQGLRRGECVLPTLATAGATKARGLCGEIRKLI